MVIYNCSFVANGGYGINDQGAQWHSIDNNHYHNNTSGPINGNGTTINTADINTTEKYGKNNQTGDPKFASTTDGSEDFTPQSGSPLINNGLDAGVS